MREGHRNGKQRGRGEGERKTEIESEMKERERRVRGVSFLDYELIQLFHISKLRTVPSVYVRVCVRMCVRVVCVTPNDQWICFLLLFLYNML